jgi:hypothetical protein
MSLLLWRTCSRVTNTPNIELTAYPARSLVNRSRVDWKQCTLLPGTVMTGLLSWPMHPHTQLVLADKHGSYSSTHALARGTDTQPMPTTHQ